MIKILEQDDVRNEGACRGIVRLLSHTICLILADPLMSFCWVVSQLLEVEKCSSRYEIEK